MKKDNVSKLPEPDVENIESLKGYSRETRDVVMRALNILRDATDESRCFILIGNELTRFSNGVMDVLALESTHDLVEDSEERQFHGIRLLAKAIGIERKRLSDVGLFLQDSDLGQIIMLEHKLRRAIKKSCRRFEKNRSKVAALFDEYEANKEEWIMLAKHLSVIEQDTEPSSSKEVKDAILFSGVSVQEVAMAIAIVWRE